MTDDGYGVCYAQLEGRMNVAITAWRSCAETDPKQFRLALFKSLCDMQQIVHESLEAKL